MKFFTDPLKFPVDMIKYLVEANGDTTGQHMALLIEAMAIKK